MNEEEISSGEGTFTPSEESKQTTGENQFDGDDTYGSDETESESVGTDGEVGDGSETEDGSGEFESGELEQTSADYTEILETIEVNTERVGINDSIESLSVEGVILVTAVLLLFLFMIIKEKFE